MTSFRCGRNSSRILVAVRLNFPISDSVVNLVEMVENALIDRAVSLHEGPWRLRCDRDLLLHLTRN